MEDEFSDVDTKLLVIPSLEEIVLNKQPVSTTHILDNDEHMDAKDIRLYWQTMRKGNINFVELMFARVQIVNPMYQDIWDRVLALREDIAYMNPRVAMKAMMGMINEKYFALTHRYPSRVEIIDKFGGYDPKQLHHLMRVYYFLEGYVTRAYTYLDLILMENNHFKRDLVAKVKRQGVADLETALEIANKFKAKAEVLYHLCEDEKIFDGKDDPTTLAAMNDVLTEFMKRSIKREVA